MLIYLTSLSRKALVKSAGQLKKLRIKKTENLIIIIIIIIIILIKYLYSAYTFQF